MISTRIQKLWIKESRAVRNVIDDQGIEILNVKEEVWSKLHTLCMKMYRIARTYSTFLLVILVDLLYIRQLYIKLDMWEYVYMREYILLESGAKNNSSGG